MMTGSIPARLTASFMATAAMRAPIMSFNVPPNVPIAVLHAETMTTSFILSSLFLNNYFLLLKLDCSNRLCRSYFKSGREIFLIRGDGQPG
jgi:hypothetical protein